AVLQGLRKLRAGVLRPLHLPIGPAFVAGDPGDDEHVEAERRYAVSIPQLLVLILADGLVHLAQKCVRFGHRQRTLMILRLDDVASGRRRPYTVSPCPTYSEGVSRAQGKEPRTAVHRSRRKRPNFG